MPEREADYVIVGAGSAGCVLAHRLSSRASVILLEAGGSDRDPWIGIPFAWGKMLREHRHDWGYLTAPEPGLGGRELDCPRGKVLGGSSSINAMAYVRGHPLDYERWASRGLPDWDFAHALPYFQRAESWEGGADEWRGTEGPIRTIRARSTDTLHDAYRDAVLKLGVPWTDDYNGPHPEGIGTAQHTIRDGRRESAVSAYLKPIEGRANLTVQTGCVVTSIIFQNRRAVGVRCLSGGVEHLIRASGEVIVAAGAIASPQLLMLSGIGNGDGLKTLGIPVQVDLPGVGENLQDHITAGVVVTRKSPGPIVAELRADRAALNVMRAHLFGRGPMTVLPTRYQAFVSTPLARDIPDIQLLAGGATLAAHPWFPGIKAPFTDMASFFAAGLHPKSRGRVTLRSRDPLAMPHIVQNFFSEPDDLATIREGVRFTRKLIATEPLVSVLGKEVAPGGQITASGALDQYIRASARTAQHPCGTCRMGTDPQAVVDGALRVRGVEGLRVVDASVMPDLVGGNINAAVVMIAERAADVILGNTLPPAPVAVRRAQPVPAS